MMNRKQSSYHSLLRERREENEMIHEPTEELALITTGSISRVSANMSSLTRLLERRSGRETMMRMSLNNSYHHTLAVERVLSSFIIHFFPEYEDLLPDDDKDAEVQPTISEISQTQANVMRILKVLLIALMHNQDEQAGLRDLIQRMERDLVDDTTNNLDEMTQDLESAIHELSDMMSLPVMSLPGENGPFKKSHMSTYNPLFEPLRREGEQNANQAPSNHVGHLTAEEAPIGEAPATQHDNFSEA